MNKTTILLALALTALVPLPTPAGDQAETTTFSGSYDWKDGGSDELSVEFVPDGEETWKVKFRFRWNGDRKTWKGTAQGTLADGSELSGTATSGNRNWTFVASISDGVMLGSHEEIRSGGGGYKTGTFELKR